MMIEVTKFLIENNITNYVVFLEYCIGNKRYDWFRLATESHTLAVIKIIEGIEKRNKE